MLKSGADGPPPRFILFHRLGPPIKKFLPELFFSGPFGKGSATKSSAAAHMVSSQAISVREDEVQEILMKGLRRTRTQNGGGQLE